VPSLLTLNVPRVYLQTGSLAVVWLEMRVCVLSLYCPCVCSCVCACVLRVVLWFVCGATVVLSDLEQSVSGMQFDQEVVNLVREAARLFYLNHDRSPSQEVCCVVATCIAPCRSPSSPPWCEVQCSSVQCSALQ